MLCINSRAINVVVFLQMDRKTIICVGVAVFLFILVLLGSIAVVSWRLVSIETRLGATRGQGRLLNTSQTHGVQSYIGENSSGSGGGGKEAMAHPLTRKKIHKKMVAEPIFISCSLPPPPSEMFGSGIGEYYCRCTVFFMKSETTRKRRAYGKTQFVFN